MKVKGTTWLLILIALSLGSWVYFYEIRGAETRTNLGAKQQQIFNLKEAEIQKIVIQRPNQTIELLKSGQKNQPWQMKQPKQLPASDATVSFLVDLMVNGTSDRTFTASPAQLAQYGLDQPLAKITVELNNQTTQTISLGKPSLNNQLIYATTADLSSNSTKDINLLLVPINWQYAVDRELAEWHETQPKDQ